MNVNNLTGNLPEGLNALTHLRKLNLAFNAIEGQLPLSITDITSLQELQLFWTYPSLMNMLCLG